MSYLILIQRFLVGGSSGIDLQSEDIRHVSLVGDGPALPALCPILHLRAAAQSDLGHSNQPQHMQQTCNALGKKFTSRLSCMHLMITDMMKVFLKKERPI